MSWFGTQRSFFFSLAVKHVGQEQMFMHPKYASNYASVIVGRTQSLHCRARGWQDTKAMPLTVSLCLRLPLSHSFGTIIPLFNWAVWSCFTPVHPHWLPFCPISPPLIRLSVINNDRQKMAVHSGALVPPRCQRCSSTPHAYTTRSS